MNEEKRAEILAKANELKESYTKNSLAEVLEHYYIFGTLDLNSVIQEDDCPRSEHYLINELQSIVDEVYSEPVE